MNLKCKPFTILACILLGIIMCMLYTRRENMTGAEIELGMDCPVSDTNLTLSMVVTNTSCNGGEDGKMTVTVEAGGTGPYSYKWAGQRQLHGTTGDHLGTIHQEGDAEEIKNLAEGSYTVVVRDNNGNCGTAHGTIQGNKNNTLGICKGQPAVTKILTAYSGMGGNQTDGLKAGGNQIWADPLWCRAARLQDGDRIKAGNVERTVNHTYQTDVVRSGPVGERGLEKGDHICLLTLDEKLGTGATWGGDLTKCSAPGSCGDICMEPDAWNWSLPGKCTFEMSQGAKDAMEYDPDADTEVEAQWEGDMTGYGNL